MFGVTQADGTFAIRPFFPDRSYQVTISAADYANATQELGSPRGIFLGPEIRVTPAPQNTVEPGKTLDVTMKLLKTDSFIAGQVVDASGNPLSDVQVTASIVRAGSHSVRTDASGRFRIEGLVAGERATVSTFAAGARSGQSTPVVAGTADARIVHAPSAPRAGGPRGGLPSTTPGIRGAR
jgi:hypothetical protein